MSAETGLRKPDKEAYLPPKAFLPIIASTDGRLQDDPCAFCGGCWRIARRTKETAALDEVKVSVKFGGSAVGRIRLGPRCLFSSRRPCAPSRVIIGSLLQFVYLVPAEKIATCRVLTFICSIIDESKFYKRPKGEIEHKNQATKNLSRQTLRIKEVLSISGAQHLGGCYRWFGVTRYCKSVFDLLEKEEQVAK